MKVMRYFLSFDFWLSLWPIVICFALLTNSTIQTIRNPFPYSDVLLAANALSFAACFYNLTQYFKRRIERKRRQAYFKMIAEEVFQKIRPELMAVWEEEKIWTDEADIHAVNRFHARTTEIIERGFEEYHKNRSELSTPDKP